MNKKFSFVSFVFLYLISVPLYSQLKSTDIQADYIVIYPQHLEDGVQEFIHWRELSGLEILSVEIDDIYSEFGDTVSNEDAIRHFLSYAVTFWRDPKPQYALFVGNVDHIPTYRVPSQFSDFTSVDEDTVAIDEWFTHNIYTNVTKPSIALGRFPVRTTDELINIVSKIIFLKMNLIRHITILILYI